MYTNGAKKKLILINDVFYKYLMNEDDYIKNVVNLKNCWESSLVINNCKLNSYKDSNIFNWNMKRVTYNYYNNYMENYYIGYSLLPYDNFNYLKYNVSKIAPWVNNEWLPFWGKLTQKKSKLMIEIKFYWIHKLLNQININNNIILVIKEKLKKRYQ